VTLQLFLEFGHFDAGIVRYASSFGGSASRLPLTRRRLAHDLRVLWLAIRLALAIIKLLKAWRFELASGIYFAT
jgi:hypothetical protein